jgi:p-aminobenzoyl-glutamate transporter AbgT
MRLPTILFFALIILLMLLTGCSTAVPVARSFPGAPEKLMEKCPPLQKMKDEVKLSNVAETTVSNYTTYYECEK